MPCTSDSRQNVLHSFLYTVSSHRSRQLFIVSLDGSIFYSCEKGAVLGVVALLALHSNVLVMYFGTAPTAGHPAMVVVKRKESVVKRRAPFLIATPQVYYVPSPLLPKRA